MILVRRAHAFAWRLALLCVLAFAAGCASVNYVQDPVQAPPKAGESPVVLSITGNTAQVTAVDSITVRRVHPAAKYEVLHILGQVAPGLSRDTSLFVGVMPEGEYEFLSFRNSETRRYLNLSDGTRRLIGTFTVRGGKPVDLGRILVTPLNTAVLVGRSMRVTSNLPLMRRFATEQMRFFSSEVSSGWTGPRTEEDRVEEYALSRPVGADSPAELADRRVVAASRLGTVLIRDTNGQWRGVQSDGLESLLDVMPGRTSDAVLYAAGEMNTLVRLASGSDKLDRIDTGNLPPGNLLFVDGDDRTGWYVAHQKGKVVTLFRSAKLERGQWQPVCKETVGLDFWEGRHSVWFWRRTGGFSYAVTAGSIHSIDYASGEWRTTKAPGNGSIQGISYSPTGSIGAMITPGAAVGGGILASLSLSKDEGRTWSEVKSEFKVKVSPPSETMSGTLLVPGGVFGTPELHASVDGGRTWQRRSDFPLRRRLVVLPSGAILAVDRGDSGIFSISRSKDEGATWDVEYSNFDSRAYNAQTRQ